MRNIEPPLLRRFSSRSDVMRVAVGFNPQILFPLHVMRVA
jgi:hypothetical protein